MRLLSLSVASAQNGVSLLDGASLAIAADDRTSALAPVCLVGANGSGKSQLMQLVAEIFQSAWHAADHGEERDDSNRHALFEIQYEIGKARTRVRLRRTAELKGGLIEIAVGPDDGDWTVVDQANVTARTLLPPLIVGYTSGDNETFSLPFFVSRSGYSRDVSRAALPPSRSKWPVGKAVPDNRLLLIDYATHLEVLVSSLLLSDQAKREAMIEHAKVRDLASFRCVVQLNHSKAPGAPAGAPKHRKGIQLTQELETAIEGLKSAATAWSYDVDKEVYVLDYLVDEEVRKAFRHFFVDAAKLHRSIRKLALLNDLAISKTVRDRLKREIETRRFASRLPEPQDEDKVFRFEQVTFHKGAGRDGAPVDYVSLSDGEHQFAQVLAMLSMVRDDDVLFLLDEPESHFNPQWRLQFTKTVIGIAEEDARGRQEMLLTTHAPFVPCDLPREQVLILRREGDGVEIAPPEMETYGATFDRILAACFGVNPPISQVARDEIGELLSEGTAEEIGDALTRLGPSVSRSYLADRKRELEKPD
jgi:restriction system-associated AAA family ATPase